MPDPVKKIEISEAEFLQNRQLRATVGKLLGNKQSKLLVLQAQRVIDPTVAAPELDEEIERRKPIDALSKEIADLKAANEKRDAEAAASVKLGELRAQQDQGWAELRKQRWTQAGMEGVQKIMDAKGILDPRDAAAIFLRDNPPQTPVQTSGTGTWDFLAPTAESDPAAADLKALIESKGESMPIVDRLVRTALQEHRAAA